MAKKTLKDGDLVYIPCYFRRIFIEPGIFSKEDGVLELCIENCLEFRFPEASKPMMLIHRRYVADAKKIFRKGHKKGWKDRNQLKEDMGY